MKYAPKKVFIKENEIFIEITNEEHESRKATDEQYAKRWFIPLQGCLLEVDEQFYNEYYKEYERNRYLAALDRKNKVLSIEAFEKTWDPDLHQYRNAISLGTDTVNFFIEKEFDPTEVYSQYINRQGN